MNIDIQTKATRQFLIECIDRETGAILYEFNDVYGEQLKLIGEALLLDSVPIKCLRFDSEPMKVEEITAKAWSTFDKNIRHYVNDHADQFIDVNLAPNKPVRISTTEDYEPSKLPN